MDGLFSSVSSRDGCHLQPVQTGIETKLSTPESEEGEKSLIGTIEFEGGSKVVQGVERFGDFRL
jgi:hypothetical protein